MYRTKLLHFQILRCYIYWSRAELKQAKPAQHKNVPQNVAKKLYEEVILPIYEKANIKLLTKNRVMCLITSLHKEYQ